MKENVNTAAPELIYPPDGFVFDTHTELQNEFICKVQNDGTDRAIEWLDSVKNNTEQSTPMVINFEWEDISSVYLFEISEYEDFKFSNKTELAKNCFPMDNLKIGIKYFWRVNGGEKRCFYTKDNLFRFINLDGALNVRDVGGVNIKQGLIYRGSDIYAHYKLTDEGKNTFLNVLKIKTELELRKEGADSNSLLLDADIKYKKLPYRPYKESFEKEHRKGICDIFEFLSEKDNYPIYIHCLGGADRTGMIAFFLRAIAGEDDEIINLDYELTSLSTYAYGMAEGAAANGYRSRNSDYYKEFLDMLDAYFPSASFKEKVTAFLLDCGVKRECIEKIQKIICKKRES